MSARTIDEAWPGFGSAFTVAELDRMPDDGHRYELFDGVLVVGPGRRPSTRLLLGGSTEFLERYALRTCWSCRNRPSSLTRRRSSTPIWWWSPWTRWATRSSPRHLFWWSRSGRRAPRCSTLTGRRRSTRS